MAQRCVTSPGSRLVRAYIRELSAHTPRHTNMDWRRLREEHDPVNRKHTTGLAERLRSHFRLLTSGCAASLFCIKISDGGAISVHRGIRGDPPLGEKESFICLELLMGRLKEGVFCFCCFWEKEAFRQRN